MPKRKRKTRKNKPVAIKRKTRYYPVVFCLKENIVIGLSESHIALKADRFGKVQLKRKVSIADWNKSDALWLDEEHTIDMSQYNDGDMVLCSSCSMPVDFRIFPSNEKPKMINKKVKEDSRPWNKSQK